MHTRMVMLGLVRRLSQTLMGSADSAAWLASQLVGSVSKVWRRVARVLVTISASRGEVFGTWMIL